MDTPYDVEEWASGTTRGRQVFNYNYRMLGTELKGWELVKVATMRESQDVTERVYLWQSKSEAGREMIRVGITERRHWRLAQESLHEELGHSMRPDIPRGTKQLAQLGDVNLVGREADTDIAAAISFTRGNVHVSIKSAGEKNVDVSKVAAIVDRALSEPPTKSDVETGQVRARTPRAVTVKADEAHILIKNLQEAAPRDRWLKIVVPDGELSREGDALIYVSTQGGKKQVGIFAAGSK